jgi:flagellar biosynthesis GTPase FlhF
MSSNYPTAKPKKTAQRRTPNPPSFEEIHRQKLPNQPITTQRTPAEEAARAARKADKAARLLAEAAKLARAEAEKRAQEEARIKEEVEAKQKAEKITQREKYFKGEPRVVLQDYSMHVLSGIDLKEFMRDIQPYPVNNPIDYHHYKQIEEGIKQITTLDNCINVVEYDDGTLHILDGQHRQRSLCNLEDYQLLKKEVIIHKYRSDEPFSDRTIKLFNKFNTLKPFKIEHKVTDAIAQIIKGLRRDCKGFGEDAIKNTNRDSARQPAMSEKEFSSFLEPFLNDLGPGNYTISDIIKYINEVNLDYGVIASKETPDKLFSSTPKINSERKIDMLRTQFYLNTELSRNYWIAKVRAKLYSNTE